MTKEKSTSSNSSLPPFLQKLRKLTDPLPPKTSKWDPSGKIYQIIDPESFNIALKKFFKGNPQTFIRQLHFYSFKKVDVQKSHEMSYKQKLNGQLWGFEHEEHLFVKNDPENQKALQIKRKTKVDPESQRLAEHAEVQVLRSQVDFLQYTVEELQGKLEKVNEIIQTAKKKRNEVAEKKKRRFSLRSENSFDKIIEGFKGNLKLDEKDEKFDDLELFDFEEFTKEDYFEDVFEDFDRYEEVENKVLWIKMMLSI
eukprot:snap_masked-scaffold_135-processed-gene-0.4-mRNA-1 protein AED:1.00 eAED:1.00 QI:0/-1/0/0/-1/1/1/0/253